MSKGCICHVLGYFQGGNQESIQKFKKTMCEELDAIKNGIIIEDTKRDTKYYSMIFYFKDISKEELNIKMNEKYDVIKQYIFLKESQIIEI